MPWSRDGHVIELYVQWLRDPDIESSFASNQTSNIFNPKILHASLSAPNLPRYRHEHLVVDTLISTKLFLKKKSYVSLMSRRRSSKMLEHKLIKITCRSMPFSIWWWWSERGVFTLFKGKPLEEPRWAMRETAGWTRPGLTLGTSTSASTAFPVWRRSVFPVWWRRQKVESLDVTLDDPAGVRRWILVNGRMWVRGSSERWTMSWTARTSEKIVFS